MHVELSQKALAAAVQKLGAVLQSKSTLPALSGMLVRTASDGVTLTAANSTAMVCCHLPFDQDQVNVIRPGCALVPGRYFVQIVRALPPGKVTLDAQGGHIGIRSHNAEYRLSTMDDALFPAFIRQQAVGTVRIDAPVLKRLIRQVSFAASSSETRPILTGIQFEFEQRAVRLTATDGIRLASAEIPAGCPGAAGLAFVVSGDSLQQFVRTCDSSESARLDVFDQAIHIATSRERWQLPRLAGEYPDVKRVIPIAYATEIHFPTASLLRSLEQAAVMADHANHTTIKLQAGFGGPAILTAKSQEVGESTAYAEMSGSCGPAVDIGFNAHYMIEALRSIRDDRVTLRMSGSFSPMLLLAGDDECACRHVVTPVRTY